MAVQSLSLCIGLRVNMSHSLPGVAVLVPVDLETAPDQEPEQQEVQVVADPNP